MTTWTEDQRDFWGRPKVRLPNSDKSKNYTRATTFIKALDDSSGLIPWKAGLVALGLTEREDLRRAVANNRDDIKEVRRIAEQAAEHAGGSTARERGSALHKMTEEIDAGLEPWAATKDDLADLDVYRRLTLGFEHHFTEQATVLDEFAVAGTPDRISYVPWIDDVAIVDLKTGPDDESKIGSKGLLWAAQLAVYAHSDIYDPATGERSPNPANKRQGFILWLPGGQARGKLIGVDLVAGWEAVKVAAQVREFGRLKGLLNDEYLPSALPDTKEELRALWTASTPAIRKVIEAKAATL